MLSLKNEMESSMEEQVFIRSQKETACYLTRYVIKAIIVKISELQINFSVIDAMKNIN